MDNEAMKKGKRANEQEARKVAEKARERRSTKKFVAQNLFLGNAGRTMNEGFPPTGVEDAAKPFLRRLEAYVQENIDGEAHDREGSISDRVLEELAGIGAFGIKLPGGYGGLGLSQSAYGRALEIVGRECGALSAYLSAHQSIGVPEPLQRFGTAEQKERYLPRIARGALSAFALTEPEAGSDPANITTTATRGEDGNYTLNGEKLWTTNGPHADLMIVMARTTSEDEAKGISAFIVESDWAGVEVTHECEFMGLKAISNGVMRFNQVQVPQENLLGKEGQGLKIALTTLNTGRLSLPALCGAAVDRCLQVSREWASTRVQWGQPIGRHEAIGETLGSMAATAYAMRATTEQVAAMADDREFDIRIEAAMAKLWHSERAWEVVNDAVQIRGGRGYETARSLAARGEDAVPLERMLRDMRINTIFEGSSEILRLFIAREALDPHLRAAGHLVRPEASSAQKFRSLLTATWHYARWYPGRWLGWSHWPRFRGYGSLAPHARYVERTSRRLARATFHAILRHGPGLEKRQCLLGRLVDIGTELFIMTATIEQGRKDGEVGQETAALFCQRARLKTEELFRSMRKNTDAGARLLTERHLLERQETNAEEEGEANSDVAEVPGEEAVAEMEESRDAEGSSATRPA